MPQIEIMGSDLPHTLFMDRDKGKVSEQDVDDALRLTIEAAERRKMQERGEYTVDGVFGGALEND